VTQLTVFAHRVLATLGILAISQTISVVVLPVGAVLLEVDVASGAEPSVLTLAFPLAKVVGLALAVIVAVVGTSLQSAVLAIVTIGAEASPVGADAVHLASRVTFLFGANIAGPAIFANTTTRLALSVWPAIQIATLFGAVFSGPLSATDALLRLQVKVSVTRAIRQTLPGLLVHLGAVGSAPTLTTNATSLDAESVAAAVRVWTVSLFAIGSCESFGASAVAVDAGALSVAVCHLTLVVT